jgi:hypothetical protein
MPAVTRSPPTSTFGCGPAVWAGLETSAVVLSIVTRPDSDQIAGYLVTFERKIARAHAPATTADVDR